MHQHCDMLKYIVKDQHSKALRLKTTDIQAPSFVLYLQCSISSHWNSLRWHQCKTWFFRSLLTANWRCPKPSEIQRTHCVQQYWAAGPYLVFSEHHACLQLTPVSITCGFLNTNSLGGRYLQRLCYIGFRRALDEGGLEACWMEQQPVYSGDHINAYVAKAGKYTVEWGANWHFQASSFKNNMTKIRNHFWRTSAPKQNFPRYLRGKET